jgi:hypothetical protein
MKERKEPSPLSFKGGREGAVSQTLPLMRRFKTPVTLCTAHDLHAASSCRLQVRHVFTTSASSHGPLTTRFDACRWRAPQLLGALTLCSLERAHLRARLSGLLSVFMIPGYPSPPAPGPLQGPSFTEDRSPTKKTLIRRRLMRRTMTKTAKDQKTSSRGVPHEGTDHIHVSSVRSSVEQEDKDGRQHTAHAIPTRGRPAPAVPT